MRISDWSSDVCCSDLHVLRAVEEEGIRKRSGEIKVYVPTDIALYILNDKREALAEIEQRYGFNLLLARDDTLIAPNFRLEQRSDERRVGKACVRSGRSRWSRYIQKKKKLQKKH